MITANSGISRFRIKSDRPGVSVVSFGYGDRFISYMTGNSSVSYESAQPICSMFASASEDYTPTVNINSLSDVIANEKYFAELAEKKNLTPDETVLALKTINIVTLFGADSISDDLLIAIDALIGNIANAEYYVFYEYEAMRVSEMVPQSVTANGIHFAMSRANVMYFGSLFLRFTQMKTPEDSLMKFNLSLWNNGTELEIGSPVIVTMKMPSGYIHKDGYKLCLTDNDGTTSWVDYTYNANDNTITFRTSKFGTFDVKSYNGTITNNDYENILNWFKQNQRTVAFIDDSGKVLSVQSVFIGQSAIAPEVIAKDGYTFIGWDMEYGNIKDNMVVTALYEKNQEEQPIVIPDNPDNLNAPKKELEQSNSTFADMQNHWANGYVGALEKMGIFDNLFAGTFNPDVPMTRGMYVILAARIIGEDSQWLYDNEIILGYGNGDYGLADEITREQIAVITKRIIDKLDITIETDNGSKTYADSDKISSWAVDAVYYNYRIGCMIGDDVDRFNPQKNVTNAEIATMLFRIAGYFMK